MTEFKVLSEEEIRALSEPELDAYLVWIKKRYEDLQAEVRWQKEILGKVYDQRKEKEQDQIEKIKNKLLSKKNMKLPYYSSFEGGPNVSGPDTDEVEVDASEDLLDEPAKREESPEVARKQEEAIEASKEVEGVSKEEQQNRKELAQLSPDEKFVEFQAKLKQNKKLLSSVFKASLSEFQKMDVTAHSDNVKEIIIDKIKAQENTFNADDQKVVAKSILATIADLQERSMIGKAFRVASFGLIGKSANALFKKHIKESFFKEESQEEKKEDRQDVASGEIQKTEIPESTGTPNT